jgi:hypothetical protein
MLRRAGICLNLLLLPMNGCWSFAVLSLASGLDDVDKACCDVFKRFMK